MDPYLKLVGIIAACGFFIKTQDTYKGPDHLLPIINIYRKLGDLLKCKTNAYWTEVEYSKKMNIFLKI